MTKTLLQKVKESKIVQNYDKLIDHRSLRRSLRKKNENGSLQRLKNAMLDRELNPGTPDERRRHYHSSTETGNFVLNFKL